MNIKEIDQRGPGQVSLWVTRLATAYGSSIQSVFEMGRVLHEARNELKPLRHWTKFLKNEGLPFGCRKAQTLVRIYSNFKRLPAQTIARLPSGWAILNELSTLAPNDMISRIQTGEIHPKLTLHDAKVLTGRAEPKEARRLGAIEWALKVEDQAAEYLNEWEEVQKGQAAQKLLDVVKKLQANSRSSKPAQLGAVQRPSQTPANRSVRQSMPARRAPEPEP